MNLSFDNLIFIEPFSLIISIILFYGCYSTGNFLIEKLKFQNFFLGKKNYKFFSILFIINLIQPILYFSALIGIGFKFLSLLIGIIFIFFAFYNLRFLNLSFKYINLSSLIYFPIILYFFSSLGPITNADSLSYHSSVATYILNYGQFPDFKIWFETIQASAGETIIALGFFFKSEQFGSLIQFSGLLSIFGCFFSLIRNLDKKSYIKNILFISVVITCPIFIQLSTSIKPQLFYIGSITFIFTFIFFNKLKINIDNKIIYTLILIFLANAFVGKFSFLISSFFLYVLFIVNKINTKKNLLELFSISFIVFIFLILPSFIFKNSVYGIDFLSFFISPFPTHLHGYDNLYRSIVSDRREIFSLTFYRDFYHWFNIIIPTNITAFTNSIGLGSLLLLYIKIFNRLDLQIIIVSIIYVIIVFLGGQQSGRFIIDPYIWLSLLAFYHFQKTNRNYLFLYLTILQPILVTLVLTYSIIFIGHGSLSNKLKVNVMNNYANGYKIASWANDVLKNIDDTVIYTHRSISLAKFKVLPGDFLLYIDLDSKKNFDKNLIYFQEILKLSPKYILFYGEDFKKDKDNYYKNFFNCAGKLIFSSNGVGKQVSRNIFFNKSFHEKYNGYIYEFKIENFPNCLK